MTVYPEVKPRAEHGRPAVRRPTPKWLYWVATAVWLGVGAVGGYAFGQRADTAAGQFETARPAAQPEKAFQGARLNWVGSGMWSVPNQAPAGAYIVAAGNGTFGCSWSRLSSDDGKPKSVIDAGTVNRGGFDRFTIGSGDRWIKLEGDCAWAKP